MKEVGYFLAKVKYKLRKNSKEVMSNYFRRAGMTIGQSCNICCNIMTSEPYLIEIGDNTTIAGNVTFITHDNSVSKILLNTTDLFSKIKIGNNCFIGSNVTILYGVTLPDNTVVAAGSVVTRSFTEKGIIIAGNPAKKVSDWTKFKEKNNRYAFNVSGMSEKEKKEHILLNQNKWIKK